MSSCPGLPVIHKFQPVVANIRQLLNGGFIFQLLLYFSISEPDQKPFNHFTFLRIILFVKSVMKYWNDE